MAYSETRSLLRPNIPMSGKKIIDIGSSSSDDWSSSYSNSSGSQSSSDDSYTVEWESYVARDGTLFYLEYNILPVPAVHTVPNHLEKNQNLLSWRNDFKRTSMRRSKKTGIRLGNLINSNHSKKVAKKKFLSSAVRRSNVGSNRNDVGGSGGVVGGGGSDQRDTTNKVKFNEMAEGEVKEITVFIDPSMRHKYGRRTSVSEALLGISVCPFPDSTRIMIAGNMPNSEISQNKAIKIGDWLKAINDQDINIENFELILLSFTQPTYIKLQLQRIAVEEPPQNHPNIAKVTNTGEYVDTLRSFYQSSQSRHDDYDHMAIFNLLLLSLKESNEHIFDGEDVLYSYPPKESNFLYSIRGTFVTMNSLFRECTFNSRPKVSCVAIQSIEYYVSYYSTNDELLLVAIPAKRITLQDAKFKLSTIVRCLEYTAKTLSHAFFTNSSTLQKHHSNDEYRNFAIDDICSITKLLFSLSHPWSVRFENILQEPHYVVLPKEGQLRIDDALNEMEAMDYREWNDEPLKSQREFYILGSALYFRKYLLASHLPKSDLLDIEAFLRTNGIYLLIENKPVRELIIWREIYPNSFCSYSNHSSSSSSVHSNQSRWFLTIVARNQLFMAVILESRHKIDPGEPSSSSSANVSGFIGPSRFYIDEIQDTLDHLHANGIENLANTWLNANKRPETLLFKEELAIANAASSAVGGGSNHGVAQNVLNVSGGTTTPSTSTAEALTAGFKSTEVISILKRRNNSTENVNDNLKYTTTSTVAAAAAEDNSLSLHSQTYSDNSLQKYGDDDRRRDHDDDDDDESDSDWDGFPDSQRSSSGFDMSDIASTFFREISDVLLSKVTAGKDNVLFHYVQVEKSEGMIFAPPSIHSANVITYAFHKTALLIHNILQNTIRFRHLLSQEASAHSVNQSLVAIREHGILVSDELKSGYQPFWVIGRLFTNPSKEVYICHRADVPQNLVEIAYRLTFHSAG